MTADPTGLRVPACPTCRRTVAGEEVCPRCGTDLRQLHRVAAWAQRRFREGVALLRRSRGTEAVAAFDAALRLRDSPAARHGRMVALAGDGRFAEALREIIRGRD